MNFNKKSFILFLIFMWSVYVAWAIDVQSTIKIYPESTTRYDLWLLPYLILFTAYAIYLLIRKQDTDNR